MDTPQDDYVREKTRRVVGRAALKRASRMVENWRQEEREKRDYVLRVVIGVVLFFFFIIGFYFFLKFH